MIHIVHNIWKALYACVKGSAYLMNRMNIEVMRVKVKAKAERLPDV